PVRAPCTRTFSASPRRLPPLPTRRSSDLVSAIIDARGDRTTFTYDDAGRQVTRKDALGNVTTWAYDSRGLQTQIDARGNRTTFTDRKSTRLNSSHEWISYAVFCLKKKKHN